MVVSVHYFGLCTMWGALEWGRVSCATIPKGEERVAGYGRLRPEQQRKTHAVGFHWDGRSTDYEDELWCTEVVAARGRRGGTATRNSPPAIRRGWTGAGSEGRIDGHDGAG